MARRRRRKPTTLREFTLPNDFWRPTGTAAARKERTIAYGSANVTNRAFAVPARSGTAEGRRLRPPLRARSERSGAAWRTGQSKAAGQQALKASGPRSLRRKSSTAGAKPSSRWLRSQRKDEGSRRARSPNYELGRGAPVSDCWAVATELSRAASTSEPLPASRLAVQDFARRATCLIGVKRPDCVSGAQQVSIVAQISASPLLVIRHQPAIQTR